MKHKTAELEGALLDAAVAMANGWRWTEVKLRAPNQDGWGRDLPSDRDPGYYVQKDWVDEAGKRPLLGGVYRPSKRWEDAGPIIEREKLNTVMIRPGEWWAEPTDESFHSLEGVTVAASSKGEGGPTPLIAAMRAYVASRFGEEVDLP